MKKIKITDLTVRQGEVGTNCNGMDTSITTCKTDSQGICCMMQGTQSWCSVTTSRGGLGGCREVQERGDICIPMADSC